MRRHTKKSPKLVLSSETVRKLDGAQLEQVAAGTGIMPPRCTALPTGCSGNAD